MISVKAPFKVWLITCIAITSIWPDFLYAQRDSTDLYYKALSYYESGEYDRASEIIQDEISLNRFIGDKSEEAWAFSLLSKIRLDQGRFPESLDASFNALELFSVIDDKRSLGVVFLDLSYVYVYQQNYDQALKYCSKAHELFLELSDSVLIARTFGSFAAIYRSMGQPSKSVDFSAKAVACAKAAGDLENLSVALSNLALGYMDLERYDTALVLTLQSADITDSIGREIDKIKDQLNIGAIKNNLNDPLGAIPHWWEVGERAMAIDAKRIAMEGYLYLSIAYGDLEVWDSAYYYRLRSDTIRNNLYSETKSQQLAQLEARYETEKKDRQIAQSEADRQAALKKAKARMNWLLISISIMLSAGIGFAIYRKNRKAREITERVELERRALRARMNPHFIFNCLNAMQKLYIKGEIDRARDYAADFGEVMRQVLEDSEREFVTLNSEVDTLTRYLNLEKGRLDGLAFEIETGSTDFDTQIPPMLIQPFVENAIWHGIAPQGYGTVKISFDGIDTKGRLTCVIEDNGVGYRHERPADLHDPKGVTLVQKRLGKSGSIEFEDVSPSGTRVTLKIPTRKS